MVLACSTVADTLNWSKFNATPVYADTMVCAHHRSVVLNNGLRMAQFPTSMLLVSQAMQSPTVRRQRNHSREGNRNAGSKNQQGPSDWHHLFRRRQARWPEMHVRRLVVEGLVASVGIVCRRRSTHIKLI